MRRMYKTEGKYDGGLAQLYIHYTVYTGHILHLETHASPIIKSVSLVRITQEGLDTVPE